MERRAPRVLIAGATGYVGGRLRAALEAGTGAWRLRCLAREPEALRGQVAASTEVVQGDCLEPASLQAALRGVDAAFYLVHSMGGGDAFAARDREAAGNFARAARAAGVGRIVYLGGLGVAGDSLSAHLRSRQETGALLASAGVPVIELRASVIIGSGSLSFELVRALVERLPVMICPRWVGVPTQPIAIEDVLAYLLEALDLPAGESGVFEIGGPDVVSYGDLMRELARQRGLRRVLLPVPVLTPRLSSLWLGLVTPLYARIGRQLIDSLRNPTIVRSDRARRTFTVRPRSLREAVARALRQEGASAPATRWFGARSSSARHVHSWGGASHPRRVLDSRTRVVAARPAQAFAPIARIGGAQGWYWGNALWRLRGFLDLLAGGVGMRRGRPHPHRLSVGDALDWWRVDALVPDRLLRLSAEMRLPGRAWLEFEVEPHADGRCTIRQTAIFEPSGPAGWAYWIALHPVHVLIFRGMLRAIARQAAPRPARPFPSRASFHRSGRLAVTEKGVVMNAHRRTLAVLSLAVLVSALPVVAGEAKKDIVDTAVAAGDFKTLATALQAAGLVDTLKGKGPFTVFAPTDAAFAKLPAGALDSLLKDKAKLTAVLTYHVVPGKVMAGDVLKLKEAKTVQGQSLTVRTAGGVKVDAANVTTTDIEASNGVIHVIDAVVMPK